MYFNAKLRMSQSTTRVGRHSKRLEAVTRYCHPHGTPAATQRAPQTPNATSGAQSREEAPEKD